MPRPLGVLIIATASFICIADWSGLALAQAPQPLNVSVWQLTDQELDDLAAATDATDPVRASELRHLKVWRRDHPAPHSIEDGDRTYLVLR